MFIVIARILVKLVIYAKYLLLWNILVRFVAFGCQHNKNKNKQIELLILVLFDSCYIFRSTLWTIFRQPVHILTRNRYDINAHTKGIHSTRYWKKQNHGDIPQKMGENKLNTNSIIVDSFCNTE
jgi:hypothetical protein